MPDATRAEKTARPDLPFLKAGVSVVSREGQVTPHYLRDEIVLEGVAARLFDKLSGQLDGKSPLGEIATRVGESSERLRALSSKLEEAGGAGPFSRLVRRGR